MAETTNKQRVFRYFVELSYCGTDFSGWQVQPGERTVQGDLIDAFSTYFREPTHVIGAGRTDSGVHARQMYAHFDLVVPIENRAQALYRLNRILGRDIALRRIMPVPDDAHARFQATERAYAYRIARIKDPFLTDLAWHYERDLDFNAMQEAASLLTEYRDFACFCKADADVKTTLCDVRDARWEQVGAEWVFHIRADRFLRNMVRAIVGTLVEVGEGKRDMNNLRNLLDSGMRTEAGTSAPACGLYLTEVHYPANMINQEEDI